MLLMFRLRKRTDSSQLRHELRFVRTVQAHQQVVFDKKDKRWRASSAAFAPSSSDGGLSGDLEQILADDGLDPTALYPSIDRAVGAVTLTIAQIRGHGLSPEHDPVEKNWYHGSIFGIERRHKEKLQKQSIEIISIDQVASQKRHDEYERAKAQRATMIT